MSHKSSRSSKVAYMEAVDDEGNVVEPATYAASAAPSPSKEKMNISKKKSRRGQSPSGAVNGNTDSDSTLHPSRRDSRSSRSSRHRDKSIPPSEKKAVTLTTTRAPVKPPKPNPDGELSNQRRRPRHEASYYGVDPAAITSAASRPRSKTAAPRPSSYYGPPSRPPVSNARYHQMHPHAAGPPPPPPSVLPPSSLPGGPGLPPPGYAPSPQPPWLSMPSAPFAVMGPPPFPLPSMPGPVAPQHDHFPPPPPQSVSGPRNLQQRFALPRPQTSLGHRQPPAVEHGVADPYEPDDLVHDMRRFSLDHSRALSRRPSSARPPAHQSSPFAPPPEPYPMRGSPLALPAGYDEHDAPESIYQDQAQQYDYYNQDLVHNPSRTTRRLSIDPASIQDEYQQPARRFSEVTRSTGARRNSYYEYGQPAVPSGVGFEDKMRLASSYQEEKGSMPLTADVLREASRSRGPRSRSTRSSDSRDESDWLKSATTRTTRSSNEEDLTIRVRGAAVFRFGDAEMECQDGTEINIRGQPTARRSGSSDKSSYVDPDDRRSRFDRPPLRNRATSQAASVYAHSVAPPPLDYAYGGGELSDHPFAPREHNRYM